MPTLIKPARLKPGMTIGLISPAGGLKDPSTLEKGIAQLEKLDLRAKLGKSAARRMGYLAGTDRERLDDLHAMFRDRKVDAIMCVRGGYGCLRIADAIDYDLIRRNPKIFIGFSDITTLSLAMLKLSGLVTFSGPMLGFTFASPNPRKFSVAGFLRTLGAPEPAGSIWQEHPEERSRAGRKFRVVRGGRATGPLTGACLSLVAASIGTRHQIETKGRIVFLEDLDETPYRVDRMLTQLLSAGLLRDAAGIAIGRFLSDKKTLAMERKIAKERRGQSRLIPAIPTRPDRDFEPTTDEVIAERLRPLGIPVVTGLPIGHIRDYATIPFGIRATLDADRGDLIIEEGAVI